MLHPIFSAAIQRPDLIVEHMSAYGALLSQDAKAVSNQLLSRVLAYLLAVICGSVFISMVGVALMLGFVYNQFHWVLVIVPASALFMTVLAAVKATRPLAQNHFAEFKAQLSSDSRALRSVS